MDVLGRDVLCQGKVTWLKEDPELACEGCTQFRFAGGALNPPRLRSQREQRCADRWARMCARPWEEPGTLWC